MAIHYDFYKTTGAFGTEDKWYPRLVENGRVDTDEMMQRIEHSTTMTVADLKGALDAFISQIGASLAEGKSVHIDGLGHFSLSIGGEVVQGENGRMRLKSPSVRSVNFRPESSFMQRLDSATFTSKEHLGRQSATVDETTLPEVLASLSAEKGYFTTRDFQSALRLTVATANRNLRRLCAEGVIKNVGSRRFALYKLCGGE